MKTFDKFIFMISSLCLLAPFMLVSIAMAVTYEYTTIDFHGASFTEAYGINDSDQIVGAYISGGIYHGFLFDGSSFRTIDFPGAYATEAYGINDAGQIVGNYYLGGISHGFLYDGSSFKTIDFPSAHGINDAGQIVGTYSDGDSGHGFLFDGSGFKTIDFPGAYATGAYGINDAGQIAGIYMLSMYGFASPSFLFDGSSFRTIDISGAYFTQAFGINNSGQIVGRYSIDNISYARHGFLYDGSGFKTIDFPGAYTTDAYGINNAGQIVGNYSDYHGTHGFVATPIIPQQLFVVIPGINDHGNKMLQRAKVMFREDNESLVRICEAARGQLCDLVKPSDDQVRQEIIKATKKAKEKGKDVIVNVDMDLEQFILQYPLPPGNNRWYRSVEWAGGIANMVSEAFREENPSGFRILYAHSAGVDATKRSIQLKPGEMMYDDLNLFNGRTPAKSLRNALLSSGYGSKWWRVKVFTNTQDLPWLTGPSSLSNYDKAKKWAGEAWVHLHGTNWSTRGHSGLIKAIDIPVQFKINMGLPSSTYITDTVENMMFKDWSQ